MTTYDEAVAALDKFAATGQWPEGIVAIRAALDALRWRDVQEELPDNKGQTVQARWRIRPNVHVAYFDEGTWFVLDEAGFAYATPETPTHWRPLGPGPGVEG